MKAMLQMSPDQLVDMPEDIRQDFFDRLRSPISSKQFDSLTFENLTNKFGINALAGISHNQQVLNALLFVAKLKAGASDQEMQTLAAMAPETLDFSKTAFLQASKILSQIGDECIQNLISSMEAGNSGMYSEGMPDLECGDYKFKISAGGEFVISTNSLNQSGKIVKGLIGNALAQTIMDPNFTQNNPNVQEFLNDVETYGDNYSDKLLPDNSISAILSSPELMAKFQNYQVISPNGKSLGNAIDEDGNVNPAISLSSYEAAIKKSSKNLIKGGKNNEILRLMASNLLKTSLRGDGINKESSSPNHISTSNGIFKLTDDYIGEIAKTAKIDVKKNTQMIDNENISKINKSAAKNLGRWRAIIESNQPKFNIEKLFVNRKELQPIKVAVDGLMDEFSFDINTSLVPGFKPEEINAIEYNYVTIDGKTTKIPVTKSENSTPGIVSENYSVVNEIIYESLTNNFLLSELKKLNLLNSRDIQVIEKYGNSLLTEDDLRQGCLIPILNETYTKTKNNTDYLIFVLENIISNIMEAERNYKKEYRNYH